MMHQNETEINQPTRTDRDWRYNGRKRYEIHYLMKLANISAVKASSLIDQYDGDRDAINAVLIEQRRSGS